jgi:4-hydroxyacetophenone monooxygenase
VTATGAPVRSRFLDRIEPITVDDDALRRHLHDAELPPLLPALAYATGDLSLLRPHLRPDQALLALPQGGLTAEQQEEIRHLALQALRRYRDVGSSPAPPPGDAELLSMLEHAVGAPGMAPYLPLLEEELAYRGEDRRAPDWRLADVAPGRALKVVVIGAGMSGIVAAYRLRQAGVEVVVFEKNGEVGGTWYENAYPGCRVDNPSHSYSYAFAQRHDWPLHFSTQPVLLDYFRRCAEDLGIRPLVRFGAEVLSAAWQDDQQRWVVRVRGPEAEEEVTADAVISAVGQLNRPSYPDIPGLGDFAGPSFHSARWDHRVELSGMRVAVIGTGASAVQFVPEIAPKCSRLTIFQRTPPWLGPTPEYHQPVPEGLRWLYRHLPSYAELNRFCMFWKLGDGFLELARVDEDWDGGETSVSAANDFMRATFTAYLQEQFAGRPDLLEAVTPRYPVFAKRVVRDNGIWPATLQRDNVSLVTTGIERITRSGVVTTDGMHHEVDVLIYGTGFEASRFLTPMRVTGRGGADLHAQWADEPRAYLGITVSGFPNLFCLYGPNTNIVANGSIIFFSECGVRYILGCLELLARTGHRALEVRRRTLEAFNEQVDAANRSMAWGRSGVNSWYKNASGRVTQNWPFTLLEYWERTLRPDPADFELSG